MIEGLRSFAATPARGHVGGFRHGGFHRHDTPQQMTSDLADTRVGDLDLRLLGGVLVVVYLDGDEQPIQIEVRDHRQRGRPARGLVAHKDAAEQYKSTQRALGTVDDMRELLHGLLDGPVVDIRQLDIEIAPQVVQLATGATELPDQGIPFGDEPFNDRLVASLVRRIVHYPPPPSLPIVVVKTLCGGSVAADLFEDSDHALDIGRAEDLLRAERADVGER